jgi:pyrroline-5-carboxylate reductase
MRKTKGSRGGSKRYALGFLGAGNMATAMIRGLTQARIYRPEQIQASDVDAAKRAALKRKLGVATTADNRTLVRQSDVIVIAVKPQVLAEALASVRTEITSTKLFISIAAGASTFRLQQRLGPETRIVRVMPNTPALLGRGVAVVTRGLRASEADERLALKIFRAVGHAIAVQHESMMDAVTGLSGSGPAYVYLFAEAMITGGVAAGLPRPLATELALKTLTGAAAMLEETGLSPEQLRLQVTSPGGTTLAGLGELGRRGFKEAVSAAVVTATRRSVELSRG